jgi:hypothetical protein
MKVKVERPRTFNAKTQTQAYVNKLGIRDLVLGWDGPVGLD